MAATSAHQILHGGSSDRGRRSLGERATPTALSVGIDDLVSEHASRLFAFALALTRDRTDARDLMQDACLRALEDWHRRSAPPASFGDWMRMIVRNTWLNTLRARRTRRRLQATFGEEIVDSRLAETRASRAQLERLFERIPSAAQTAIGECLIMGEAQGAVAARNGMTERAIEGAIYRVRTLLRGAWLDRPANKSEKSDKGARGL